MHEFAQMHLEVSASGKEKIVSANRAVIEAVLSLRDVSLERAHQIFGMDAAAFNAATALQFRDSQRLAESSVPIWKNRFQLRALPAPSTATSVLLDRSHITASITESFGDLDAATWSRLGTYSKGKIAAANAKVVDAIVSFSAVDDPAAHLLFDMPPASFALTARMLASDWQILRNLEKPVWAIRFDMKSKDEDGASSVGFLDRESVVTSMLRAFRDVDIPR
ncbi:hypothetical protein [Burkholderia sp. Ac-20365]|uniref:hypothetical protein n=1 Tax=Burkholderia sp. Ac-20365 TaxID=2703897 RepID=UPI00197BEBD0|nr:hypothetical protein [Burkholderia sp. Ac-20365]MBN3761081.1 hypothetical protein [Burkholderia sp. Ac-20365]